MSSERLLVYQRLNKIVPLEISSSALEKPQSIKVRLSNHATFTEINWDIKPQIKLSWKSLYSDICSSNAYNFIHLNHNSFLLKGNSGPYNLDDNSHKKFNTIDLEFFVSSIKNILHKDHWLQPPIDTGKVNILIHRAAELISNTKMIYMLNPKFNKPSKPFDNEWSHAYLEYYEYIIVTNNKVFIWNLIYE